MTVGHCVAEELADLKNESCVDVTAIRVLFKGFFFLFRWWGIS